MAIYPIYIVRNKQGQYLASYRAKDAAHAIRRLLEDDRRTASTFKKSQPATLRCDGLTAEKKEENE